MGLKWTYSRLRITTDYILVSVFSKLPKISNARIYNTVIPEGLYIMTGNDVISYFRSATNSPNATTAAGDFTVTI